MVFGPAARSLTGFYHAAPGPGARPLGIVLCNPLGFEEASAHRTFRQLADRLADQGLSTLRFDYPGTGNSPVSVRGVGGLEDWLLSVELAASELRARAGVDRVALVGLRFGATLAALAARRVAADSVVLWAPLVSGRAHVRALRALRLLTAGRSPPPPLADGGEEIGGYVFATQTLEAIAAIDLLASKDAPAPRALVLARREGASEERRLAEHLGACGVQAQVTLDAGYAQLLRDNPYDALVPVPTLEAIVGWLAEGAPPVPRAPARAAVAVRAAAVAAQGEAPALRERPVMFGPASRLYGVVTEPVGPWARERPAVCFLNVGANHLAAPHRINVQLAREVAARGQLAFRFDASGLGDSGGAPGAADNRLYTLEAVADVQAALNLLFERYGVRTAVLVGLCSGAYLAFHTAARDDRVVGQVLISPYAFEWQEGDAVDPTERVQAFPAFHSSRFYAQAVFDPRTWLRLSRGEVQLRSIAKVLARRLIERLEGELQEAAARLGVRGVTRSEIERTFKDLSGRGVASLVVVGFQDGGLDVVAKYLGPDARRMRGRRNFALEILKGVDHTFTTALSRRRLSDLLKRQLDASAPRFGA